MTDRRGTRALPAAAAAALATLAVAIAGCTAGASSVPTAIATSGVGSPAVSSPGATPEETAGASATPAAGTTITDWGEIRDAVPAGFPLPPGAEPADLPEGPYSGAFTTPTPAAGAATAVEVGLRDAGWTAVVSGPTEAGEVTIDAAGAPAGCRARVSVRPLGGLTAVVVLYGAACP